MAEYIEREAAIAAIKKDIMGGLNYESILKRIPSADVQPVKHGRWIPRILPLNKAGNECSACLAISVGAMKPYYCPNCGAKMDGET